MTQPWMKFYPADWRSDPKLRLCSLAARGLWMEMLALMHEAEPYGHLTISEREMTPRELANLVGIATRTASKLLEELEINGVYSRDKEGIIFSRRMVRDAEKAQKDRENGAKGGNPRLMGGVNPQDKAQKPEARSQKPDNTPTVSGPPDFVDEFWKRRPKAESAGIKSSLMGRMLKVMDPCEAIDALDYALTTNNPPQYIGGVLKSRSPSRQKSDLPPAIQRHQQAGEPVKPLGNGRWRVGWDVLNEKGEVVGI